MTSALAIGSMQKMWTDFHELGDYWTASWQHLPILGRLMGHATLPHIVAIIQLFSFLSGLFIFALAIRQGRKRLAEGLLGKPQLKGDVGNAGSVYISIAQAAGIANLLFIQDVVKAAGLAAGYKIKLDPSVPRFVTKVFLSAGLRFWFKVSMLQLLVSTGHGSRTGSVLLSIASSLASFAGISQGVLKILCTRLGAPGGCIALAVIFLPVLMSILRFAGVYYCDSHLFNFSEMGCVPVEELQLAGH